MWMNLNDRAIRIIKEAMASKGRAGQEVLDIINGFLDGPSWTSKDADKYRAAAARKGSEGSLEVDADAVVSEGDDPGAYVMAWLWVTDEEAGIDPEPPGPFDWSP